MRATCTSAKGEGRWFIIPMLGFAFALAWRDSPTLNTANAIALVCCACLGALSARAGQIRSAGISQYLTGVVYVWTASLVGMWPTLRIEIGWRELAWQWRS